MSDAHTPQIPYAWEHLRSVDTFLRTIFTREKSSANEQELLRHQAVLAKMERRASMSVKDLRADEAPEMFELAEVLEREFPQAAWTLRAIIAELYLHHVTVWLEALTSHADGDTLLPEDELLQLVRFATSTIRSMHTRNTLMTKSEEVVMCFEVLAPASRYEAEVHPRIEMVRRHLARAHEDSRERASDQQISTVHAIELERMFKRSPKTQPTPRRSSS